MNKGTGGKGASRIALGGIIASLMSVIMLASYFPYLTYAIPAAAGLLLVVPMVEMGVAWSVMTYLSASVVVLLTAEGEAKILFLVFFGYYPIIKALVERLTSRLAEYIIKFSVFNLAVGVYGIASVFLLSIPISEFTESVFGVVTLPLLILGGNIVFWLYDKGLTQMITLYILRIHPTVKKLLK